ncbi:protein tyrosine phosphatase family protein [Lusitaniella coriacea LEGE 07157]|uniref:Protein tyrosine phosphatase family protein n=1 Tax=Lusitaniella coriacea LEGE 07157 TaxID=945747 RepID=A0A8J7DNE4_9CYAN|nr:protein tyrosine phosphatase family protein [Lusitaniella coriacea]MBE9114459.1 protein tyrosine phosphatase family protein [Lusitaniella coriacea LEGE 07157]
MDDITNYYLVTDNIATSGQPNPEQFQAIAEAGYEVIINLAMPTSDNALADEGAIVTQLGMSYIHLPVVWEAPKLDEVRLFFGIMQVFEDRKVWVHCALNMRVSCFLYLYQKHVLEFPDARSRVPMINLWQPNPVWQKLIQEAESAFAQ